MKTFAFSAIVTLPKGNVANILSFVKGLTVDAVTPDVKQAIATFCADAGYTLKPESLRVTEVAVKGNFAYSAIFDLQNGKLGLILSSMSGDSVEDVRAKAKAKLARYAEAKGYIMKVDSFQVEAVPL